MYLHSVVKFSMFSLLLISSQSMWLEKIFNIISTFCRFWDLLCGRHMVYCEKWFKCFWEYSVLLNGMLCIRLLGPLGLRCQEEARIHELHPGLPPGWQESNTWTVKHCFPGTLKTGWIGSKVVRNGASTPLWKVGVPSCFVGNF